MTSKIKRLGRNALRNPKIAVVAIVAAVALLGTGAALAAELPSAATTAPALKRESPLERGLAVHAARERYRNAYRDAKRSDVEPKRNLARGEASVVDLKVNAAGLRVAVAGDEALRKARAKAQAKAHEKARSAFGTPASVGVDQGTLDSIAACESGGNPTAVDSSGTYRGKYQFDLGTWASVGGSGDPAAAPEAEQDYRAALLLSRAGSSPWPVCG